MGEKYMYVKYISVLMIYEFVLYGQIIMIVILNFYVFFEYGSYKYFLWVQVFGWFVVVIFFIFILVFVYREIKIVNGWIYMEVS